MTLDSGKSPEHSIPTPSTGTELKIQNGEKVTTLRINEFKALFSDIERFNDQFSLGSMMIGLIRQQIGETEDADSSSTKFDTESQQFTASGIHLIHSQTLDTTGLTLETVSGKSGTIVGKSENLVTGELRLNISDRNRFLDFLQSIDPSITKNFPLCESLQNLSNILSQQIFDK